MPNFLSRETYDRDNELLREILINKSSEILIQNVKNKIQNLSDLDEKIISFVLNYKEIRSQESIDLKKWTYIFNLLFNEELREQKIKIKSNRENIPLIPYEEYSFWELGDRLVQIGVGYWTFYLSAKGNVRVCFDIPDFIYESIKEYRTQLPIIEDFTEKVNELERRKEEKWSLEDFDEVIDVVK